MDREGKRRKLCENKLKVLHVDSFCSVLCRVYFITGLVIGFPSVVHFLF